MNGEITKEKKKLLIWGGNEKPLELQNLNSHASVTAFFLTQELRRCYEIVHVLSMDAAEEILTHDDVFAVLSTFQRGFTNRLIKKGKGDLFQRIREHVKGPLCSVYDFNYDDTPYGEDIIFSVRPPSEKLARQIRKKARNRNIQIKHMGWCADPGLCKPSTISDDTFNVFMDHPPYVRSARDDTAAYYKAAKLAKNAGVPIRLFAQDNRGIVEVAGEIDQDRGMYDRQKKVPWSEIVAKYGSMHAFCITTPQSACLSAIEAAMCGAKLYVPVYRLNRAYIPSSLLTSDVPFRKFRAAPRAIARAFEEDARQRLDRAEQHERLARNHSWSVAANRIHQTLESV